MARTIDLVTTAKMVRAALKSAYPGIKFSVRTERYSMGCCINVSWTDGPTSAQVETITRPFHGKRFEMLDDSTHYIDTVIDGEAVHFAADSCSLSRELSATFLARVAAQVAARYQVAVPAVKAYDDGRGDIAPTPEAFVRIPDAPPFNREERLVDVIYHVAHRMSALAKPRVRVYPTVTVRAE